MKKLAIGCAVVIVLGIIGVSAVAYYAYYKVSQYAAGFKELGEVANLDKNVTNKASFPPPVNGELTENEVRRFVAVQETMHTTLGPRLDELSAKQKQPEQLQHAEHRNANVSEVFTMLGDLVGLIKQAKTAQVAALNAQHFSIDEYKWVRGQVYTAAGMAAFNFGEFEKAIQANGGTVDPDLKRLEQSVPARNKTLVEPYLPKLKDYMTFAFFGL